MATRKKSPNDEIEQSNEQSQPKKKYQGFNDYKNYVRIGCFYYYRHMRQDARGHVLPELIPWKEATVKQDISPKAIQWIPRYVGAGCYPSNIPSEYQVSVGGYFNTYQPPIHYPCKGEWPHIEELLRHIFGHQYELGLDYVQLLYLRPLQFLPILVLVSEERGTGKTTFLNLLKAIFGPNMSFVTNETMRSNFNSERVSRVIVACDEAFLNKKEDSERLKAISTALKTYVEFKGRDRYEVDNFAKTILCSNDIYSPVYIDRQEIRYWVIEVKPLSKGYDPDFLAAMEREIPAFLYDLLYRQMSVPEAKSRMWFSPEDIHTAALDRIVRACRPTQEIELAEALIDLMDLYEVNELKYTSSDLMQVLRCYGHDIPKAHHIIAKQWCVPHATNKLAYDLYAPYVDEQPKRVYGRYYSFSRDFLSSFII